MKHMKILDTDLAWAAGFMEADGATTCSNGNFRIQVHQSDTAIPVQLQRFADLFEASINGPYGPYGLSKKPQWQCVICGSKARLVIKLLLPYMTEGGAKVTKALSDMEKAA